MIIGGGDTGADCLGTSHRQKATLGASVRDHAPSRRMSVPASTPWPLWPLQLRIESSHEEGGMREWAVATTQFSGDETRQREEAARECASARHPNSSRFPAPNSSYDVDLVLLAMGFTGPVRNGMIEQLGVELDVRGNVATDDNYRRRCRAFSPPATCGAASRWWCGRSRKAAKPRAPSTSGLWAEPICNRARRQVLLDVAPAGQRNGRAVVRFVVVGIADRGVDLLAGKRPVLRVDPDLFRDPRGRSRRAHRRSDSAT